MERRPPPPVSRFKELLFRKAKGKCFKCLSPDHRVAECQNLAKCLLCGEFGHKARWCKGKQGVKEGAPTVGVTVSAAAEALRTARRTASTSPPTYPARARKLGGMEAPATYADQRKALVCAAAPRSADIADAEQRYSRYGVVAVGWCPDLELTDVGRLFARQLRLHESEILVTMRAPGEYILLFDSIDARNLAVQWQGVLNIGSAAFMISAWTRFRGARAGKLCYKARVCIEGVSADEHQVDTIRGLFAASDIIDSIDTSINSKEESACCRVWVWMENVGKLARRDKLDLALYYLRDLSDLHPASA
jgi:hypothetical protein